MRKMPIRIGAMVTVITALAGIARAKLRSSFSLDQAGWDATDIVVAVRAPRTGTLTVLEVWKGGLQIGAGIDVAGLPSKPENDGEPPGRTGPVVAGNRMILFLKPLIQDHRAVPDEYLGAGQVPTVSVVWVDADKPYGLQQQMNPGPAELTAIADSEEELHRQINAITKEQEKLTGFAAAKDAPAISQLCLSTNLYARRSAMQALGACGDAGLSELRKMAGDPRFDQPGLISALIAAAGPSAPAEITALLQKEALFWKQKAPALIPDWWNDMRPDQERLTLQGHYTLLSGLLWYVGREHDVQAAGAVGQLNDLFSATPALNDPEGMLQSLREARTAIGGGPAPIGPVQK